MNELTEQILGLQPGDHLCLIYDRDPAEQMPALVPLSNRDWREERSVFISPMIRRPTKWPSPLKGAESMFVMN